MRNFMFAALAIGLLPLAACDRNKHREVSDNSKAGREERVVGVNTSDLNKQGEEKGSAEVQTQKEVTRTITSEERIPTVVQGQKKADINRMSSDEFTALGFPRSTSDSIVEYRDKHGEFKSVDDLQKVPGMNPSTLSSMRDKLGASSKH